MPATFLDRAKGLQQGRIQPVGWTPPSGTWAYVFGSDAPLQTGDFQNGDGVLIEQIGSFAAGDVVNVRLRMRCPADTPGVGTYRWVLYAAAAMGARAIRYLRPSSTRDLVDVSFSASDLGGGPPSSIDFYLLFEGTPGTVYYGIEIPSVYLDGVTVTTAASRLLLLNRDPEPAEQQVPRETLVAFDLADTGPSGIDLAHTQVWINGQLAYNGGVFVAPFDGPESIAYAAYPFAERFVFDYTVAGGFPSLTPVFVIVQSQTPDLGGDIYATYYFNIEDVLTPELQSVTPRDLLTLRVVFNEAVLQVSPSGEHDALNPSSYNRFGTLPSLFACQPLTFPGANCTVTSVNSVDERTLDLTLDIELSPGATYRLKTKVADLFGNLSATPTDQIDFAAPELAFPATRRFDIWKMLPELNRREDTAGTKELKAFVDCLQEMVDLQLADIDRWTDILDVDLAPEAFVDAMLYDLGNPFSFDLSEIDKRRLVRVLITIYKQKGTAVGIVNVIRFFLGLTAAISCGLDPPIWILGVSELGVSTVLGPGSSWDRYSYIITIAGGATAAQKVRIEQLAEYMQPAHTHLLRIDP